jgi:excinuclease UvrABC ATPase subunit
MTEREFIEVRGARENNLKDISLEPVMNFEGR